MFDWLKLLLGMPVPAGPSQVLKHYSTADTPISQDVWVNEDEDAWCMAVNGDKSVPFFEVPSPEKEKCVLTFKAQIRTENLDGKAFLEMWCRFPGKGEFFSRGLHHALKGSNDWSSCETRFYLRRGQKSDLVKLNLAVEGAGKVCIRNLVLEFTPLK